MEESACLSNLVATAREFFSALIVLSTALVDRLVEAGGLATLAASALTVGPLVLRLGLAAVAYALLDVAHPIREHTEATQ